MKTKNIFAIAIATCVAVTLVTCTKDTTTIPNGSTKDAYKTSVGGALALGDSIVGTLGTSNAQVVYFVTGNGRGIQFKCYDQNSFSSDSSYADVKVLFGFSKADLKKPSLTSFLIPSSSNFTSKQLGAKDSVYVLVYRDSSVMNNAKGKFVIKVADYALPFANATEITVTDATFKTSTLDKKGLDGNYENWYKFKVTKGNTYRCDSQSSVDSPNYTLDFLNFTFYKKDGLTTYDAKPVTRTSYDIIAEDEDYIYVRCFNQYSGTHGIRILEPKLTAPK